MRIFREARGESTAPFILVAGGEDGLAFCHIRWFGCSPYDPQEMSVGSCLSAEDGGEAN